MYICFDAVYFPRIQDMLKSIQMKKQVQKQSKSSSNRCKNQINSQQKNQSFMELEISNQIDSKTLVKKDCHQSLQKLEFNHLSRRKSELLKAKEAHILNQGYQSASMNSQIDPKTAYSFPSRYQIKTKYDSSSIPPKIPSHSHHSESSNKPQQKAFHEELKKSLVENASSQIKSQRLSMIFESTRKKRDQKKRYKYFGNHSKSKKSKNTILTHDMDERSIKNIRKSFCLSILQNDQDWDEACSRSVKLKNNESDRFG